VIAPYLNAKENRVWI